MAGLKDKLKETAEKMAEKASDQVAAETIEVKKAARAGARAAKAGAKNKAAAGRAKAEKAVQEAGEVAEAVAAMADDQRVAAEIEVKKTAAKAAGRLRETVEKQMLPVEEKLDELKLADQMARGRKKAEKERKAADQEKKAEAIKEAVKMPVTKARAARLNIVIQSPYGGEITPEQITARVPKEAKDVYVRIDENKLYWVGKDGTTGMLDIW